MKLFLLGLIVTICQNFAFAAGCNSLHRVALSLNVHGLNLANYETTSAENGKHYRKRTLICNRRGCHVEVQRDSVLRHQPGHPHANENGYVKYPHIVKSSEWKGFNAAVRNLRKLAKIQACSLSAEENLQKIDIKYKVSSVIKSDSFQFEKDGRVHSWARTFRDGQRTELKFSANGSILPQAEEHSDD